MYTWDEYFGMYTHAGAKDAFEKKKGSSGDINLSMVAALQDADLKADPVNLSDARQRPGGGNSTPDFGL